MRLCFIDESGHPHPNDSISRPVLLATSLPVTEMRNLTRQVYSLKRNLFGDTNPWLETKFKSKAILNERTFMRIPAKWEYVESMFELAANTSGLYNVNPSNWVHLWRISRVPPDGKGVSS
jgi:uncharacterized protein DUF3800